MRRAWLAAAAAAAFGACASGPGGCGDERKQSSGQSTSFSGGASAGGGPTEAVSFEKTGFGLKGAAAGKGTAASTSTALGAPVLVARPAEPKAAAAQDVLCGGFPGLPDDCLASPRLEDLRAKCCPGGEIVACRAVPGGARLTARGCPAAPGP